LPNKAAVQRPFSCLIVTAVTVSLNGRHYFVGDGRPALRLENQFANCEAF